MSWREFRFNLRPITLLAFGCVVFTTCAVAAAAHWLLGMPLAVGACIGRVVRLLPNGIAIRFIERQNPRALERLSVRAGQTEPAADFDLSEPAGSGAFVAV